MKVIANCPRPKSLGKKPVELLSSGDLLAVSTDCCLVQGMAFLAFSNKIPVPFWAFEHTDLHFLLGERCPWNFWVPICLWFSNSRASMVCEVVVSLGENGLANVFMMFGICFHSDCSELAEVNGKWHQWASAKLCLCPVQRSTVLLQTAGCISCAKVGVKQRYSHLKLWTMINTRIFVSMSVMANFVKQWVSIQSVLAFMLWDDIMIVNLQLC